MTELVLALALVAVMLAWLWREREHTQERARLVERLTGISLSPSRRHCDRSWTPRKEALVARKRRAGTERLAVGIREREGE